MTSAADGTAFPLPARLVRTAPEIHEHDEREIEIAALPDGRHRVTVHSAAFRLADRDRSVETRYPPALIRQILAVKGLRSLNDEIRREEDPLYTRARLEYDILAYLPRRNSEESGFWISVVEREPPA